MSEPIIDKLVVIGIEFWALHFRSCRYSFQQEVVCSPRIKISVCRISFAIENVLESLEFRPPYIVFFQELVVLPLKSTVGFFSN